jgi:Fur family ferric uptake transcriptional regulator
VRGSGLPSLVERLRERGIRMTVPRVTIAQVIDEAGDHPDLHEVHRRALVIDPRISVATVYRTMRLFEGLGLVERHAFRGGPSRFERAPAAGGHDHLIDTTTGRVVEFRSEEIERLQADIAERLGYRLVGHRLELYAEPDQQNTCEDHFPGDRLAPKYSDCR